MAEAASVRSDRCRWCWDIGATWPTCHNMLFFAPGGKNRAVIFLTCSWNIDFFTMGSISRSCQISLPESTIYCTLQVRAQPFSQLNLYVFHKNASNTRHKNHQGRRSIDALVGGATAKVTPLGLRVSCFEKPNPLTSGFWWNPVVEGFCKTCFTFSLLERKSLKV